MYREARRQEGAEAGRLLYSGASAALASAAQTLKQPDKKAEATLWRERCARLEAHLDVLTASRDGPMSEYRSQEAQKIRTPIVKICRTVNTIQGADKELSEWASLLLRQAGFLLEHLRNIELSSLVWTLEHIWNTLEVCRTSLDVIGALRVAVSQRKLFLLMSFVALTLRSLDAEVLDNQIHLSTMCAVLLVSLNLPPSLSPPAD